MPTPAESNKVVSDTELMIEKFKIMEAIMTRDNKNNDPRVDGMVKELKKTREDIQGKLLGFESLISQIERMDKKNEEMKASPVKMAFNKVIHPIDSKKAIKMLRESSEEFNSEYDKSVKQIGELVSKAQSQVENYKSYLKNPDQKVVNEENKENISSPKPK